MPSWHTGASQLVPGVKNPPVNIRDAGDVGATLGSGRPPGKGSSKPLQFSCLESLMDRGAWWATISGVMKSQTQVK